MNIRELSASIVRIRLKKPIRHASHVRTDTENIIVRCVLDDGTVGFGEGVPREYVTGESATSALALLQSSDIRSQRIPCPDFPAAVAFAERLTLAPVPGDARGIAGNAARCALELAVLDAYGKRFGSPLSQAVKLVAPELYAPRTEVRYSGAITSAKGWKAKLAGWKMRLYGFKQVKVKVGIAGYDDVKRLASIRSRCGKSMDLRIDANEAWTRLNVVDRIRELLPFGITSIEQPVAHEEVMALTEVRQNIPTPIMLDESLCGMYDAQAAIVGGWCDLFNIRLSKCGGFLPSLRLAQTALDAGLGYQLGCQVGETAILSAAGRHFAQAVRDIRYLEGSYDKHLVLDALGTTDMTFGYGGKAPALTGGGLGMTVDETALAGVTKERIEL